MPIKISEGVQKQGRFQTSRQFYLGGQKHAGSRMREGRELDKTPDTDKTSFKVGRSTERYRNLIFRIFTFNNLGHRYDYTKNVISSLLLLGKQKRDPLKFKRSFESSSAVTVF